MQSLISWHHVLNIRLGIWNYKNKKMMQCLIQIKSLSCLTQIQVNTLDSTVNFWLEGTIFLHKSVNREENMFSLKFQAK